MTVTQYGLLGHLARYDGIGIGALAEKLIMDRPLTGTCARWSAGVRCDEDRIVATSAPACLHLTAAVVQLFRAPGRPGCGPAPHRGKRLAERRLLGAQRRARSRPREIVRPGSDRAHACMYRKRREPDQARDDSNEHCAVRRSRSASFQRGRNWGCGARLPPGPAGRRTQPAPPFAVETDVLDRRGRERPSRVRGHAVVALPTIRWALCTGVDLHPARLGDGVRRALGAEGGAGLHDRST